MSAALIGSIISYVIQYGPSAVNIIQDTIAGVRRLQKDGHVPTDVEIKALTDRIMAQHAALPVPE